MSSLRLDVTDSLLLVMLKVFQFGDPRSKQSPSRVVDNVLNDLQVRSEDLVVVESLATFITRTCIDETMAYFEDCNTPRDMGLTILYVVNSYAFS